MKAWVAGYVSLKWVFVHAKDYSLRTMGKSKASPSPVCEVWKATKPPLVHTWMLTVCTDVADLNTALLQRLLLVIGAKHVFVQLYLSTLTLFICVPLCSAIYKKTELSWWCSFSIREPRSPIVYLSIFSSFPCYVCGVMQNMKTVRQYSLFQQQNIWSV